MMRCESEDGYPLDLSTPNSVIVFAGPALYKDSIPSGGLTPIGCFSEMPRFAIGEGGISYCKPIMRGIFEFDLWTELHKQPFSLALEQRTIGGYHLDSMYLEQAEFVTAVFQAAHGDIIVLDLAQWACKRIVSPIGFKIHNPNKRPPKEHKP